MKILQVTPLYYPSLGGLQLHIQLISQALAEMGHEVSVATIAHDRVLPKYESLAGVEIRRFNAIGTKSYRIPIGLYHFLKQKGNEFDIIHAHDYGGLPLLFSLLTCCEKTVITLHYHGHGNSPLADLMHHLYDPFACRALKHAGSIVADSLGEACLLTQNLGISLDSITIIPSIISFPTSATIKTKTQYLDSQKNKCLVLSVGRLVGYKRIDRIITAIQYLPDNFILVIIGDGPDRKKLEQLSFSKNIQDRVWFLGTVDDFSLSNWYSRSKVVISLSEGEAFGRIVIEGLSYNCQIVCSDILAFQELAKEFPSSVSQISTKLSGKKIAEVIQKVALRPISEPPNLQKYSSQRVIAELMKVYTALNTKNKSNIKQQ